MKQTIGFMLAVLALWHVPLNAHSNCDEAACAAVKERIRNIESKMRAGYTRAQGERYEARLKEMRARRHKLCR